MLKGFVSGEEKDIARIPMKGKNLFDKSAAELGKWLNVNTGVEENTSTNYWLSTYIPVVSGQPYSFPNPGSSRRWFYDATKSPVEKIDMSTTYTPTSNGFVRFTIVNAVVDSFMLNLGSTALPYEPYGYQEGWEVRDNEDRILWGREDELQTSTGTLPFKGYSLPLKTKSLLGNAVQNGTPAPDNIVMPEMCGVRTGNLFDTDGETNNKYLTSDGSEGSAAAYSYTTYIPVMGGEKYTISKTSTQNSSACHCWYDGDKQFISSNVISQTTVTLTAPASAAFLRCSYRKETVSEVMLNSGSTALPYEPYGWKVPFENHGENLFDPSTATLGKYINAQGVETASSSQSATEQLNHSDFFAVTPNESYTLSSVKSSSVQQTVAFCWYDATKTFLSRTTEQKAVGTTDYSITGIAPVDARFAIINYTTANNKVMLTPGSTPKPYSPYLNETLPVYLGEVPTVRRVKKLVLTGEESWSIFEGSIRFFYVPLNQKCAETASRYFLCTHRTGIQAPSTKDSLRWYDNDTNWQDLSSFKAWLAAQYAAGTPVTIWYVLANEQTTISNEPLCKISTYADELTTIQVHGLSAPLYGIGDYKDTLNLSTGVVTRKVKKLVLTGEENDWGTVSGNAPYRIVLPDIVQTSDRNIVLFMTTHYLAVPNSVSWSRYTTCVSWGFSGGANNKNLVFRDTSQSTLDDFKSYLAAQYAAGTPVTVWYVLSTPETETVIVPTGMTGEIEGYLTQVSTPTPTNLSVPKWNGVEETGGTYAVTVYTPPEIPTTTGENTLTVDTDLSPSSLTVKGHIKELT